MLKRSLFAVVMVLILIFAYGCTEDEEVKEVIVPEVPEEEELPEEIKAWIEDSRDAFGGRTRIHNGFLYILVTYGEKPTGGYTVEIAEIARQGEELFVTVQFSEPGEDEMVTQAITYPYDLAVVEETDLTVEFRAMGDEDNVPKVD